MQDLGQRLRSGDVSAITDMYRSFSGAVSTVARSLLWSEDLVADAVQQTFVKAWNARSGFDPERPIAPWLYAIARRTAIDIVRRERRRQGPQLSDADLAVLPTELSDVWETFEVRLALDALPADERHVMRMFYYEGRTHAEIADLLAIPVGTVKSRSHRAHGRLSESLGHLVDEPDTDSGRMEGRA